MTSRTRLAATLLAGLALLCTACQDPNPTDPLTPTPASSNTPTASPSTHPSPTPTQETAKQAAIRQARPLVDDYFRVTGMSIQDPANFDDKDFKEVAITDALVDAQNRLAMVRSQGYHQVGATELVEVTVAGVDMTNHPKRTPPEIPTVKFRVCYDVTDLDVLDNETGKSVVSSEREPTGVVTVWVSNYTFPDGPWLVGNLDWDAGASC